MHFNILSLVWNINYKGDIDLNTLSLSCSWDWISFPLLLTQRLTVILFDLMTWFVASGHGLSLLLSFTLICFYLFFPQTTRPAYWYRLLKPGLSIMFESGPIRTQVCLRTEWACKQTNKPNMFQAWHILYSSFTVA